jgi:hypothetical protein
MFNANIILDIYIFIRIRIMILLIASVRLLNATNLSSSHIL